MNYLKNNKKNADENDSEMMNLEIIRQVQKLSN